MRLSAAAALIAAVLPCASVAAQQGLPCWDRAAVEAARINEFNVGVMVYRLRCKVARRDFDGFYYRFSARHLETLRAAEAVVRRQLGGDTREAARRYDTYSTTLANSHSHGPASGTTCQLFTDVTARLGDPGSDPEELAGMAWALVQVPYIPGERCPGSD